ncbi:MAG TPA: hypothetical protein VGF01_21745, partial [Terracidiphilus sp.]
MSSICHGQMVDNEQRLGYSQITVPGMGTLEIGMGWRSSRYEFRMVFLFALPHAGVLAVLFVPFSPHLLLWTA